MSWIQKKTIDGLPYYFNKSSGEITWDKPEALMTADEREEESGDWVWIPHPKKLWQPARIIGEVGGGDIQCQPREGRAVTIPKGRIVEGDLSGGRRMAVDFWPVKLSQLNRPEEDLVQMSSVNDASIINNIRIRYEKDELYTWVGAAKSVLISVNPYKRLNLYGSDAIETYRNKPPNTHLKPHVFDIANDSYNSLLFDNYNQSILISGESGAGKTVCTKQCLDFLAQVAGSEQSLIEEKILKANPLLEAFGNAQTIRNNNSSRFGKWIEVFFSLKDRKIASAKITNYLLEKSRLVYQAKRERNYHIFYQLTGNKQMQSRFGLQPPQNYYYTNQSGLYKAHLIDDQQDFAEVLDAFKLLNFNDKEQEFVLSVTSGILTLGNVKFNPKKEKGGVTGSDVADKNPVKQAANLLGFQEADLLKVLNYRSISVRGQVSTIPLDPAKAESAKDSLSMGIYSRLFDYLVQKINISLEGETGKFIGILDIFGFEIFDQNSFEQLCINFANEKLQQQFNRTTFKEEEELYQNEGIKYTPIVFIDNQGVLDMIEKTPKGILPMLDDECKIPEGSDKKFMNKMEDIHGKNEKFQTDTQRKLQDSFNFEIVHYAGVVKYNGENFMQKNTDNLFQDMYDLCSVNQNPLFAAMFPKIDRRQLKSLSYQFRQQLNDLMNGLYKTESRYIRCIKPNGEQRPDSFDSFLAIDQLRYSGVFEAVEIRKQGYPFRFKFSQFACRYSCINRKHRYRSSKSDFRGRAEELLKVAKQDFSGCVFGKSMVLFKTKEYSTLELLRQLALETLIPRMQSVMRGHLPREMKRRCKKLDKELVAAIKTGNDIRKVDAAINNVSPVLGAFQSLFPGVFPWHLKAAKSLQSDLRKWIKLEQKLEKLLQKDANNVYYELADAVNEGEVLRAKNIKETKKQQQLMDDAITARENCTLGKLDRLSEECLGVLDLEKMKEVQSQARQYSHSTAIIDEINRILGMSEIEIVQLEIEKAKEMGDEKRRIHREIRLFDLQLQREASKYTNIASYSGLRDPMEYAKSSLMGKLFGAQKKAEMMLYFTPAATITSLTRLQVQGPEEKPYQKIVKQMSLSVRKYMGDKPLKGAETDFECAAFVASQATANKAVGFAEEAYFQVMKQLNENPEAPSRAKGFELLGVLLGTVLPADDVLKFVLTFIEKKGEPIQKFKAIMHVTQYGQGKRGADASGASNLVSELRQGEGRSRYSIVAGEYTGPHV